MPSPLTERRARRRVTSATIGALMTSLGEMRTATVEPTRRIALPPSITSRRPARLHPYRSAERGRRARASARELVRGCARRRAPARLQDRAGLQLRGRLRAPSSGISTTPLRRWLSGRAPWDLLATRLAPDNDTCPRRSSDIRARRVWMSVKPRSSRRSSRSLIGTSGPSLRARIAISSSSAPSASVSLVAGWAHANATRCNRRDALSAAERTRPRRGPRR